MPRASLHARLAFGGLLAAVLVFAVDLFLWFRGSPGQRFSLTCLGDLLGLVFGAHVPSLARVLPLSLLLLAIASVERLLSEHAAATVRRQGEEWRPYLLDDHADIEISCSRD